MTEEELKFTVTEERQLKFFDECYKDNFRISDQFIKFSSFIEDAGFDIEKTTNYEIIDCYYDTEDLGFYKYGCSLRVRKFDGAKILGLKVPRSKSFEKFVREEIEIRIPEGLTRITSNDIGKLLSNKIPKFLKRDCYEEFLKVKNSRILKKIVKGAYEFDFIIDRFYYLDRNNNQIAGPFYEIEIEFPSDQFIPSNSLQPLVSQLKSHFELKPSPHSKYEKGMELFRDKGIIEAYTTDNKIFISHGKSKNLEYTLAYFLHKLGLEISILKEKENQGRTVIEKLEDEIRECNFSIIICTKDDRIHNDGDDYWQPRPNVFHEIGVSQGTLGRDKVALLKQEGIVFPSNLEGLVYISFKNNNIRSVYYDLEKELKKNHLL